MRSCRMVVVTLMLLVAPNAIAGRKESGNTTLKDVQAVGVTNKKQKHQQYDISFASTSGKDYICRTGEKEKVKATDLVVGSSVAYEVNGDKGKVKTSSGKQLNCTIVRVANTAATPK